MSHKWTEGEVRRIVDEQNGDAALEVLAYLCERGPRVVKFGDLSDPELEEEKRREKELRELDDLLEADDVH